MQPHHWRLRPPPPTQCPAKSSSWTILWRSLAAAPKHRMLPEAAAPSRHRLLAGLAAHRRKLRPGPAAPRHRPLPGQLPGRGRITWTKVSDPAPATSSRLLSRPIYPSPCQTRVPRWVLFAFYRKKFSIKIIKINIFFSKQNLNQQITMIIF